VKGDLEIWAKGVNADFEVFAKILNAARLPRVMSPKTLKERRNTEFIGRWPIIAVFGIC
jgi:hypothetical protein